MREEHEKYLAFRKVILLLCGRTDSNSLLSRLPKEIAKEIAILVKNRFSFRLVQAKPKTTLPLSEQLQNHPMIRQVTIETPINTPAATPVIVQNSDSSKENSTNNFVLPQKVQETLRPINKKFTAPLTFLPNSKVFYIATAAGIAYCLYTYWKNKKEYNHYAVLN